MGLSGDPDGTLSSAAAPDAALEPRGFQPLQAIVALGAIQLVTMAAGLLRSKVLAVLLGPAGVGITGVVDQVVAVVAQLGSLSVPMAALKYLTRKREESPASLARLLHALTRLLLGASSIAAAIAVVIAISRPETLGADLGSYRPALLLAIASVPFAAAVLLQRNVLAVFQRHELAAAVALASGVALVLTSWVGIRGGGLTGLYAGNLVVNAATATFLALYVHRTLGVRRTTRGDEPALRVLASEPGLLGFCTGTHFLTLVYPIAYLLARLTVLAHRGATEVGLMGAAYGLAIAVRIALNQANALYLTPVVNRRTSVRDRATATGEYVRVLAVLLTAGALAIVLAPRLWLGLLYTPRFLDAAPFLGAFVIAESILLVAGVYQALLIGFDDMRGYLGISAAVHGTIILVLATAGDHMDPLAIAVLFASGNVATLLLSVWRLVSRHSANEVTRSLPLVGVGILSLVVASRLGLATGAAAVFWKALVYLVLSIGLFGILSPEERGWILSPLRGLRSRSRP